MAKIIKHTFNIPNLSVEDGELVEREATQRTYTFTLLFKGTGLYEEITGRSLFGDMVSSTKGKNEEEFAMNLFNGDFIRTLASVSYVKIEGDRYHNNRATVEEFKKSPVYSIVGTDFDFIKKLVQMAVDCINAEGKDKKSEEGAKPKK